MKSIREKPLGHKSYGSIPHLVGSRRGPRDYGVNEGQQRICCERAFERRLIIAAHIERNFQDFAQFFRDNLEPI